MSGTALELTTDNFKNLVIESDKVVLVDFWAEWCGPCKMLSPVIDELANEYSVESVAIGKVNVDENADIANEIEKLNSEIGLPKNLGEMGVKIDMIPYLVEHSLSDVCNFTTPKNPSSKEYENLFLEAIG